MQPVMQQTNVIHVGQGGTVIFPSSQQVNQVNQSPQLNQQPSVINQSPQSLQQRQQQSPQVAQQQYQQHQQRISQPAYMQTGGIAMVPTAGTYTFVQSQPY